jgi:hypothetical protein
LGGGWKRGAAIGGEKVNNFIFFSKIKKNGKKFLGANRQRVHVGNPVLE